MHSILVGNFIPHSALFLLSHKIKSRNVQVYILLCASVYYIVENIQDFGMPKYLHWCVHCIYLSNWM